MSVIYLFSDRTTAKKDHGRILLENADGTNRGVPMGDVDSLVVGRRAHVTMPLLFAMLERGIPLSFVNGKGELLASMGGETMTVRRLLSQQASFSDEETRLALVRKIVRAKIRRQKKLLRSYAKSKETAVVADALTLCQKQTDRLDDVEELRGCEGMASRLYFSAFPEILDQSLWPWNGRKRRPARDPVNALLNLGYAFLEREVRIAIVGARLDPRIGFFHANNGRKDSLVFDLMELFRQPVVDRFVLRTLNYGALSPDNFRTTLDDGCRLTEKAFPLWCAAYEDYMEKPVKAYGEETPRAMIRKEVRQFAETVFQPSEPAQTEEEGDENP